MVLLSANKTQRPPKMPLWCWPSLKVNLNNVIFVRLREVSSFAELKELRLKVMDLETQTQLTLNQLKRQTCLVDSLQADLDLKNRSIKEQQDQAEELLRKHTDMEGKLKDQSVRERIRDVEKAQSIAELKQIISNLEFQVSQIKTHKLFILMVQPSFQNQQLIKNSEEKDQLMNLEDTMSNLRQQVGII